MKPIQELALRHCLSLSGHLEEDSITGIIHMVVGPELLKIFIVYQQYYSLMIGHRTILLEKVFR